MKALHRPEFWGWSEFNPERNLDFHSVLWIRPEGNCAFDPLPMSEHDLNHLKSLGTLRHILISNSDHLRFAIELAEQTGATLWGPASEPNLLPRQMNLSDGQEPVPGLRVYQLEGSKTPGELAFLIDGHTLITGDLIRSHQAGKLCLLPEAKLKDKQQAQASVRRFLDCSDLETVLTGDGWPIFGAGRQAIQALVAGFT
ncbi:MBL fold metallo-hydrolase [bacterium (Candidatus Blackallbacteria) CG17_big_fil_post_rev_8_21_14_2_50_48_46]|uniref:MBL fold metallo-hydrolase n=1 Tax=bacterium (Candidatus Blackallbacteria) CG17_big_fil_post_rev_8_21_14_2_50_48_46 TaxID=2014261 RepID=A0A2M7G7D6_9BACT|nr:MAG: MBL fold metallo-hydrolase [bacterium (Candidatus Blackallbacteria) CG18_big_fil_WC_8_21_14_2_50_49_26]PIW17606.1 MAG: MBL fold metallo-hydrolase [bacterium (Candidatus Blackallbacteria) CG17_big_fil_post_rev_8_21_14_2_50_48_46]PIW48461.1 MAG: MBL fold metallo-hydrolase [bacterium (Candidatus Blackallbacteria) CG13_big_fil_rev_8_21_14_2_50_49_14]